MCCPPDSPPNGPAVTELVDNAQVVIRRLDHDDYDAVVRLATDLSTEERYMRFFTMHPAYIGEWGAIADRTC